MGLKQAQVLILLLTAASMVAVGMADKKISATQRWNFGFNYTDWFANHRNNNTGSGPNRIIVGGSAKWQFGFNYTDWALKNGPFYLNDALVFKYDPPVDNSSHPHSVVLFTNFWSFLNCDLTRARRVANTTQGGGEGFEFRLKKWQPYYFACGESNGFHCDKGLMKFAVMPLFSRWHGVTEKGLKQAQVLILLLAAACMIAVGMADKNISATQRWNFGFNYTDWFANHRNNNTGSEPNRIIVGGSAKWQFGFNYTDWALKNGPFYLNDTLVFKYDPPVDNSSHPHSVYLFTNFWSFMNCDLTRARQLADPTQGGGEGFEFRLKRWQPYYFACGESTGFHCDKGLMKFAVTPLFRRRHG
ncbi:hypothetical protein Vadar_003109 [Vaccinium darrowii]|uniref:Uncharacterized protein n=1 Tax=Vaccinium darrowii TaxID=229202 RepID=A0ACB7ZHT6_9ERIC|nr:hypothetical protein Vadar_003109 [Vaccinium darrowii]